MARRMTSEGVTSCNAVEMERAMRSARSVMWQGKRTVTLHSRSGFPMSTHAIATQCHARARKHMSRLDENGQTCLSKRAGSQVWRTRRTLANGVPEIGTAAER